MLDTDVQFIGPVPPYGSILKKKSKTPASNPRAKKSNASKTKQTEHNTLLSRITALTPLTASQSTHLPVQTARRMFPVRTLPQVLEQMRQKKAAISTHEQDQGQITSAVTTIQPSQRTTNTLPQRTLTSSSVSPPPQNPNSSQRTHFISAPNTTGDTAAASSSPPLMYNISLPSISSPACITNQNRGKNQANNHHLQSFDHINQPLSSTHSLNQKQTEYTLDINRFLPTFNNHVHNKE